jgi:hypothetical protein
MKAYQALTIASSVLTSIAVSAQDRPSARLSKGETSSRVECGAHGCITTVSNGSVVASDSDTVARES